MGGFVDFYCRHCRYAETDIGVGRGREEFPFLRLFRCDNCKSVGSTWVHENRIPRCSVCYHDAVTLLADDTRKLNCPKCGDPAEFVAKEGSWE
ncbi:MAG TPA: hypothetical protein VGA00_02760 [Acidiferrobacterales bacterium]|jgi:hypothetical protein